ncbi:MAG: thioredoxin family protein [Microgenomates group bacterium]
MKNTSIIIIVMLILAVGGVGAYALMNRTDSSMTKLDSMEKTETMVKDEKMMQKEGTYTPFSPELLVNSASTRRVLFFYANWCPTCKPADKSFSENSAKIPADVTVIRVNYNDTETDQAEKDLAKKYGVTYQHTYVQIDTSGKEIAKWNGGQIDELLSNLK